MVRKFSGSLLQKHRKAKGLSRFKLAKAINFAVGEHAIYYYEIGKNVPNTDVMLAMADVLGVQPKELIDAEG